MGKSDTVHIGIFGRMNVGKSSFINAAAAQKISIVDSVAGTTTDPVKKTVELPLIGPVVFIDTPGIDDDKTELGKKRVAASLKALDAADIAIIIFDSNIFSDYEKFLIKECKIRNIKYLLVHNKSDIASYSGFLQGEKVLDFSSKKSDVKELLANIKEAVAKPLSDLNLLNGLAEKNDVVVLVIPIDAQAPHGRIILPQVQTIRNLLDIGAAAVCVKDTELDHYLKNNKPPKLVVTDSQAFKTVAEIVPKGIALTSFSIIFARAKADFKAMLSGVKQIDFLKDGDRVLILESCTHRTETCDDIGRCKIPKLLEKKTGAKLEVTVVAGCDDLPENIKDYKFAVQCGGCMHTNKQLENRLNMLKTAGVAFSNYGMVIAYCNGILERAAEIFKP